MSQSQEDLSTTKTGSLLLKVVFGFCIVMLVVGVCVLLSNQSFEALPKGTLVNRLVVEKSRARLSVFYRDKLVKSYSISTAIGPNKPKTRQGDLRTPEGHYMVDFHNSHSAFHKSLHISYPSPSDVKRARDAGVDPGGDIMLHGLPNGLGWVGPLQRLFNWTPGCIALTDQEIDELYRIVKDGTPIEIVH